MFFRVDSCASCILFPVHERKFTLSELNHNHSHLRFLNLCLISPLLVYKKGNKIIALQIFDNISICYSTAQSDFYLQLCEIFRTNKRANSAMISVPKKNWLLLSGYDAASHQYWRSGLTHGLATFNWTQLSLPPRYFSWRNRSNSLSWGFGDYPELNKPFEGILATSMVDLTSLLSFRPSLMSSKKILYFHENQFAYPGQQDIHLQLTSIYSALCADKLVFNSSYNKETFCAGVTQFLSKMPDHVPNGIVDSLNQKSQILPVPLYELSKLEQLTSYNQHAPLKLLWNHRWEYDKQPEVLYYALKYLKNAEIDFTIAVIGQSFRNAPPIFEKIRTEFSELISHWGFQERDKYWGVLTESNFVLSTSLHEFQGLSVLEAIAKNCIPIAPNRMVYPEYINPENLYNVPNSHSQEQEGQSLANKLLEIYQSGIKNDHSEAKKYFWDQLKPRYLKLLTE